MTKRAKVDHEDVRCTMGLNESMTEKDYADVRYVIYTYPSRSLYLNNPGWGFTVYRGDDWVNAGDYYDSREDAYQGAVDHIMGLNEEDKS